MLSSTGDGLQAVQPQLLQLREPVQRQRSAHVSDQAEAVKRAHGPAGQRDGTLRHQNEVEHQE